MVTHNRSTRIFKCFLSDFILLNYKCIFVNVMLLNITEKIRFSYIKAVISVHKRQLFKPIVVLDVLV